MELIIPKDGYLKYLAIKFRRVGLWMNIGIHGHSLVDIFIFITISK